MSTFLGPWSLILDMNTSGSFLNEHLGQFHNGSQTAMTGIGISYNGAKVVNGRCSQKLNIGHAGASLALLAIMEQLGLEQMLDLVRYSVGWVV
jgi:hypothetical protein